jgi:hypothetical protein
MIGGSQPSILPSIIITILKQNGGNMTVSDIYCKVSDNWSMGAVRINLKKMVERKEICTVIKGNDLRKLYYRVAPK